MSLKMEFVQLATAAGANVAALCREFGITRDTGYRWISRFKASGFDGLEEQSRRPKHVPLSTAEEMIVSVVQAREAHPSWGPHKLRVVLARRFGEQTPSESTIKRILKRFDIVRVRKPRRTISAITEAPSVDAKVPNDVWTVDYKGWWRARNGERCEPLTIRDACSRFILAIEVFSSTDGGDARKVFERLFKRYGVPKAIQCDNGCPFIAVNARAGITKLSAWWISLGIKVIRSRLACPQDNGAHERMHCDMSKEIQVVPSGDRQAQQRACDKWRMEFNHVRPHDALGDKTPSEVYKRSEREPRKHKAVYPGHWVMRSVNQTGRVKIKGEPYFISTSLNGYQVALQPLDTLHFRAWFYDVDLGIVEMLPEELPKHVLARGKGHHSVPTCSNASSVRARSKRAPAEPRLTRSARVSNRPLLPAGKRKHPTRKAA